MPRPTHRLDLLLVPVDLPIERGEAVLQSLVSSGVVDAEGRPGVAAASLGLGGFARVRLDRPERPTLYANRLGGFRVRCPIDGGFVVADFARAVSAWRAGGPATLSCPACGGVHPFDALGFEPPAAFGPWALEVADVAQQPDAGSRVWQQVLAALPGARQVLRRT